MKKANKKLAFNLYKNKWGLQGYRFFRVNNPSQPMLWVVKDCEKNNPKSFIGTEITQLSSWMKAARYPKAIFHVVDEYGSVHVCWSYDEFRTNMVLRKISGL